MPKQTSLIKIRGKADGNSFYFSKNGGHLVRSINADMSQRVKTDPAYMLTRANAAEFGSLAMLLGQMISVSPFRKNYVLNPIQCGLQVRRWLPFLQSQSGYPGQRELDDDARKELWPSFNRYSKNPIPDIFTQGLYPGCIQVTNTQGNEFKINNGDGLTVDPSKTEYLRYRGVHHFVVQLSYMQTPTPYYDPATQKYKMATTARWINIISNTIVLDSAESYFDKTYIASLMANLRNTSIAQAIGFTFLAYKKVGSNNVLLQDLCSFACFQPEV